MHPAGGFSKLGSSPPTLFARGRFGTGRGTAAMSAWV
jgi:hypothetical protein